MMPVDLTNAPATIEDMMNHIWKDLLDEGIVVYIYDTLIYAKITEKDHFLVKEVLERLVQNELVISQRIAYGVQSKLSFWFM
jgi:hypothetical protein